MVVFYLPTRDRGWWCWFRHFWVVVAITAVASKLGVDGCWRLGASDSRVFVQEKWLRLDCAGCLSPAAGLAAGEAVGEEGEEGDDALWLLG